MLDWTAETWAQVVAAVGAAVAAFFAWRSARASARAGSLIVLSEDYRRLDEIRGIVVDWNGSEFERRNRQPDLRRLLRHTDDLPETRRLAEASAAATAIDEHGTALLELDRALIRIEDELSGRRSRL